MPKKKQKRSKWRRKILAARTWYRSKKRWQQRSIAAAGILIILLSLNYLVGKLWRPIETPKYGVSFSVKYAKEMGNDWQANFVALLDELGIRRYRLMSYWDEHEAEQGVYNFTDLDWQMDQVALRGGKVSLAIGYRQPRWPECHQPEWAKKLGDETIEWNKALNTYITVVVNRYKTHPALHSYQLENEAVNNWFGECPGGAPRERLETEMTLVKNLDPHHPVWMSLSDQHGFPGRGPVPDAYGFSVYRVVYSTQLPFHFYMTYPTPIWYHRIRAAAIKAVRDKPIFIHELQLEPWGPSATKDMSFEEQEKSMSVKQMQENIDFARKISEEEIYMWGAEWWYWRRNNFNDTAHWDAIKAELDAVRPHDPLAQNQ